MESCGPTPPNPAKSNPDFQQGGFIPSDETIEAASALAAEATARQQQAGGRHENPYSTQSKYGPGHQAPKSAGLNLATVKQQQAGGGGALSNLREQITGLSKRGGSMSEDVNWRAAFGFLVGFIIVHWLLNFRKPVIITNRPHVDLPSIDDDAEDLKPLRAVPARK